MNCNFSVENSEDQILAVLQGMPDDVFNIIRSRCMLRPLIQRLIIDNAVANISVAQEKINQAMSSFVQQQEISNQNELDQHCATNGIAEEELINQVTLPIKIAVYSQQEFGPKAESHFLHRKEDLDQVSYSLIRLTDKSLAHELYLQIEAGETDFETLAEQYSQGPEKQSKGNIPLNSLSRAHPILKNKLRTVTEGILMEPFEIEQWWVITRLNERRSSEFNDAMRQRMSTELFNQWVDQSIDNIMSKVNQTLASEVNAA